MHITGSCHCGKISYEAEIDPNAVSICHCADCQVLSGTAFRVTAFAKREQFHMKGEPKIYIKVAESGNKRAQAFCPDCGSPLYATTAENQQVFGIRLGTSHQRRELKPVRQIWCRSELPWVESDWGTRVEKQV